MASSKHPLTCLPAASQALNIARLAGSGAQPTLDSTLGVIFLSTPSTIEGGNKETWLRYSLVAEFFRKRVPEFAPRLREGVEPLDIDLLCRVADDFQDTIHTLAWPVLSVFEGKETRIGGRLRAKSFHVRAGCQSGLPVPFLLLSRGRP